MAVRFGAATCLVAAFTVVLIACSGAPVATPAGPAVTPGSTPEPAATDPAATPEPAPTDPPVTDPGGGGGSAIDICALVTAEEWASVTGLSVTGAQEVEVSAPLLGSCLYPTDTNPAGITSLSPDGGMWDLVWSASGIPEIAGIGDGAVWDESTGSMVVLVGDHIFSINAGSGADDLETRLEWARALAQIAVGRF